MKKSKKEALLRSLDLQNRGTLTVPTEEGRQLTIESAELKAAKVSTLWNPDLKKLQVIITWHDDGEVGSPQITVEDKELLVTVRKPRMEPSVLQKADLQSRRMINPKEEECSFDLEEEAA